MDGAGGRGGREGWGVEYQTLGDEGVGGSGQRGGEAKGVGVRRDERRVHDVDVLDLESDPLAGWRFVEYMSGRETGLSEQQHTHGNNTATARQRGESYVHT